MRGSNKAISVALGEDLENVPVSTSHDIADAPDVVGWNVFVKEVAHRVDENLPFLVRTGGRAHRENVHATAIVRQIPPKHTIGA